MYTIYTDIYSLQLYDSTIWRDDGEWVHRDLFCTLRWAIRIQHRLWQQHPHMILYHWTTVRYRMMSESKFVTLFQRLWALKLLVYIFWIYRERLCLVRSEAIPERRHNSGVGSGQNSFYSVARWEKARMAGGRSSNTANRANYHRITGESKLESESEKTSENYMVSSMFNKLKYSQHS